MIIKKKELEGVFAINRTYLLERLQLTANSINNPPHDFLEVQRESQDVFLIKYLQGKSVATLTCTDYSAELVLDNDTLLVGLADSDDVDFEAKLAESTISAFISKLLDMKQF